MQYFFIPLHKHIDYGFGATGDAFKEAADKLDSEGKTKGSLFNETLPINYLRRHAIELFIKSAIVIIHRSINLPYGEVSSDGQPSAKVKGKWIPFTKIHSIKDLWGYLSNLFKDQKSFFDSISCVDWSFPDDVEKWVDEIESKDPRSTFFRYPNLKDNEADEIKAVTREGSPADLVERLKNSDKDSKQTIFAYKNDQGELLGGYYYTGDSLAEFKNILKECVDLFYGLHAALRAEVCGGE